MTEERRYGTRVRAGRGNAPGPAGPAGMSTTATAPAPSSTPGTLPPAWEPPPAWQPDDQGAGPVVYETARDAVPGYRQSGRPRTQGRPQPEYPREGYGAYRLLGRLPAETPWWRRRLLDWLLGRPAWLLYVGITCRDGFVRWVEHSDTKTWAGDVTHVESIPGEHWATLNDTVIDESTGRAYLVFDVAATADNGIRPIRPGEAIDTEPHFREVHGDMVEVYYLDEVAGVEPAGMIVEGARTGEKRIIQAWDGGPRPVHNIEHNEGPHATNRVRRRFPRLVALARRQAFALAALWAALAVLLSLTALHVAVAVLLAACLMQGAQVARLALTGFPRPGRRKPRRPRGRARKQRLKRKRRRGRGRPVGRR